MSCAFVLEAFTPFIGQPFAIVDGAGRPFPVTLAEATGRPVFDFPGRVRDPFQLQFKSEEHSVRGFLPQQTYIVTHDTLGSMELFLVPIGPPRDGSPGFLYQSVFT
jgi:hypothetical protein